MIKETTDSDVVKKWQSLKASAEGRGIKFTMSLAHVRKLLKQKKCYFTKETFVEGHPQLGRSVDRVESDKPYSDDNTVACTILANNAKANFTIDLLKKVLSGMIKHSQKTLSKSKKIKIYITK